MIEYGNVHAAYLCSGAASIEGYLNLYEICSVGYLSVTGLIKHGDMFGLQIRVCYCAEAGRNKTLRAVHNWFRAWKSKIL